MVGKKGTKEVVIGTPRDVHHNVHVNKELDWHVNDPRTSFKLEETLGEGSFGVVYKAMHIDSLHEIAVKIIEVDLAQTIDLQNEIAILKKCLHPNIVSYFGSCATEKELWILMDYCGLGSVRDVMETCKRTLTEPEIACVLAGTLQGLWYLHHFEQPIIHKDIKSANILISERGEVKLADFGVAQQILSTLCLGYLEGTPHFMAPEIGYASKFNFKADIWSLGIAAIEMAEGRPPYADINIMRAIHMIRRYPPPTLKEPRRWSKEFNNFIERCLVKDYNDRATAEELLRHPFILNAKSQAMKDLCHEALKAKKKSRAKVKKEVPQYAGHSSPPIPSMSKWRDKKAKSMVVMSTFERGNNGSVVILNTVNVRGNTYHSTDDDSSLGTSNSSRETNKTCASISSSGSSYGTVKFHEGLAANSTPTPGGDGEDDEYGTIQFNNSTLIDSGAMDTVRFHDDVDAVPSAAFRKKHSLSSSAGSLPSPQVLSESEGHTEEHEAGSEAIYSTGDETSKIANVTVITKHETPTGTKETRSIGVQTDLPLDLKLFVDSVMRKKRHKRYAETHELKQNHKSRLVDRLSGNSKSRLNNYHEINGPERKLAISSGADDVVEPAVAAKAKVRPKVPPLPINLDLTTSGENVKHSKSKTPRTPKGHKGNAEKEDPSQLPQKSPRKKFAIAEYFSNLLPNIMTGPLLGLNSSAESISETGPSFQFSSTTDNTLASSVESSLPSCSPPSSPTASSIDSVLDSSLDSLRSSVTSPNPPVLLQIPSEDDVPTKRDSPYITPYSTTDESSDSAPVVKTPTNTTTAPFAITSPAPFTGPLLSKSQDNSPISSLLLSPPMSSSANFVKNSPNITPSITPDTTPLTSPDGTPRTDTIEPQTTSRQFTTENTSSPLAAENIPSMQVPQIDVTDVNPGTPRPMYPRNSSPLVPPESARTLNRVNATSKLGDQVKAAMIASPSDDEITNLNTSTSNAGTPHLLIEANESTSNPRPRTPSKASSNSPRSRPASNHRVSHSAPVLPTPPLNIARVQDATTKSLPHSKSSMLSPSSAKKSAPKLARTVSLRTVIPNSHSTEGSPPMPTRFPHSEPVPTPSVQNIKQTLHALSSSPPKAPALKRTASILNSNVLAAFMPKSAPVPAPQPTATPSNTMVKSLAMAFSVPTETPTARGRSSSTSSPNPPLASPPPVTRSRASTISGTSPPVSKPIPIPKPISTSYNPEISQANTTTSSSPNKYLHAGAGAGTGTSRMMSPVPTVPATSRIPKRTSSNTQPISYAVLRQNSSIPLPRTTPRARSATDVTKATLDTSPPKPPSKSPPPNLSTIFEPPPISPVPSSPEMSTNDSCLSDIPPLSLTPSPPSTPPSSRSPTPECTTPSPRTSPRNETTEKSPSLKSTSMPRPYNRHSQHALEGTPCSSHLRPKSSTSSSKRLSSPQPSPSTLRRTISTAVISPPRSISSPSLASPSSSPTPPPRRSLDERSTSEKVQVPLETAEKSKVPQEAEKAKSPKSSSPEKPPSPKEGFSIRLPGGIKFPSYTPRSPRRSRSSPRSPRPQSAQGQQGKKATSPLSSPPPTPK